MRFLIVDTYYPAFLSSFYAQNQGLSEKSYEDQWQTLMQACFGTADFYSFNLKQLGHEATEVVFNCKPIQMQWARENGFSVPGSRWAIRKRRGFIPWPQRVEAWIYPVLLAQVKQYRPDVFFTQDPVSTRPDFLREIRPYVRLIVGQIASPVGSKTDFSEFDLMLSSFPHFVERFRQQGLRSAYFNLGFEPRVNHHLKKTETHEVVFVGGLSRSHSERIEFLEDLARRQPFDWWGYGVENLSSNSPLRATFRGPAWALDMYDKLYNARIVLNHHINVSENYANNMRLYEATGVGSLLVTDFKDNLHCLFEPGREVMAYHSVEECAQLIGYYLDHEEERQAIAQAGQQRTLRAHTYYQRMQELIEIVGPLL